MLQAVGRSTRHRRWNTPGRPMTFVPPFELHGLRAFGMAACRSIKVQHRDEARSREHCGGFSKTSQAFTARDVEQAYVRHLIDDIQSPKRSVLGNDAA